MGGVGGRGDTRLSLLRGGSVGGDADMYESGDGAMLETITKAMSNQDRDPIFTRLYNSEVRYIDELEVLVEVFMESASQARKPDYGAASHARRSVIQRVLPSSGNSANSGNGSKGNVEPEPPTGEGEEGEFPERASRAASRAAGVPENAFLFDTEDIKTLFSTAEEMLGLHRLFLRELKGGRASMNIRILGADDGQLVHLAKALCDLSLVFPRIYGAYIANHQRALDLAAFWDVGNEFGDESDQRYSRYHSMHHHATSRVGRVGTTSKKVISKLVETDRKADAAKSRFLAAAGTSPRCLRRPLEYFVKLPLKRLQFYRQIFKELLQGGKREKRERERQRIILCDSVLCAVCGVV